jgi:hypothetical protein
MTLRLSLLPLALAAFALPAPALAFPHGQRHYVVQPVNPQPAVYVVRPRYAAPRYSVVQPRPQVQLRPLPPVQTQYVPHPGYSPTPVSRYGYPITDYPSSGYHQGQRPVAFAGGNGLVNAPRTCTPIVPLVGAALGGTMGAVIAPNSRNRRWALPMGAAVGGILGGVASGC